MVLKEQLNTIKILYKKDKNPHIGFLLGLKNYFLKY